MYKYFVTKYFNKSSQLEKRRILREKQTNSEKLIWDQLRNRKFHNLKFRRQFSVASYVLDFYCSEIKLAIEIDGKIHDKNIKYDQLRQSQIEGLGIKFLRFSSDLVESQLDSVLKTIEDYLPSP